MDNTALALLESRISVLENIFVGDRSFLEGDEHVPLALRFINIEKRLDAIDKDLPDLQNCRNLVNSIAPILTMKRSTLPAVVEKAKELLHDRDELMTQLNLLQSLQTHSLPDFEKDSELIDNSKRRIQIVDDLLATLGTEALRQAKEVDDLVQVYEEAMLYLRETVLAWQSRVNLLEA